MSIEVMKQALDALIWTTGSADFGEGGVAYEGAVKALYPAITALRQAIEQAETKQINSTTSMSSTSLTNQPLTDEELRQCFLATNTAEPLSEGWPGLERFARAIEAAHGIGKTK